MYQFIYTYWGGAISDLKTNLVDSRSCLANWTLLLLLIYHKEDEKIEENGIYILKMSGVISPWYEDTINVITTRETITESETWTKREGRMWQENSKIN